MRIHILGDSLAQTRISGVGKFYRGWGDFLPAFLSGETEVINYAIGGRSSRSFMNEGRFYDNGQFTTESIPYGVGPALNKIEKGDYVLISFMCNDDNTHGIAYRESKQVALGSPDKNGNYPTVTPDKEMLREAKMGDVDSYRETLFNEGKSEKEVEIIINGTKGMLSACGNLFYPYDAEATYKGYLKFYIDKVREKGAVPILVISGAKLLYVDGKIAPVPKYYGGQDEYNDFTYVEAQRQLAKELSVELIDLFAIEKSIYESIGEEKAAFFHNMVIDTGDVERIDFQINSTEKTLLDDWVNDFEKRHFEKNYESIDIVHKNHFGAFFQAAYIADTLFKKGILKDEIKESPSFFAGCPAILKQEKEILSVFDYVNPFEQN